MLFDVLMIDEASQMQVADASIPISIVNPDGRIVICGDHLQLRPIFKASFPEPVRLEDPLLATGILQCLLRDKNKNRFEDVLNSRQSINLVALCEQRRMCEPLSSFTEQIYTRFKDAKTRVPLDLRLTPALNGRARQVLDACVDHALVSVKLIRTDASTAGFLNYSHELNYECNVVMRLLDGLAGANYKIFVITPHKAQRSRIQQELLNQRSQSVAGRVTVDTVDRMQGKEADIVIICYTMLSRDRTESELEFVYDLNRLNVAITRAKQLALILCSDTLIDHAPMAVAKSSSTQGAYGHLLSFYNASQKFDWKCRTNRAQGGLEDDGNTL